VNDLHIAAHARSEGLTLVISDQPFSKWENVFSTRAMTVAAVDRLVNHNTLNQINRER
jgi:DNA replication protein DnaC